MIDKEKLLSDFFGNNYHKPMVVAPEEFMVIQKNGIMDLETLLFPKHPVRHLRTLL